MFPELLQSVTIYSDGSFESSVVVGRKSQKEVKRKVRKVMNRRKIGQFAHISRRFVATIGIEAVSPFMGQTTHVAFNNIPTGAEGVVDAIFHGAASIVSTAA